MCVHVNLCACEAACMYAVCVHVCGCMCVFVFNSSYIVALNPLMVCFRCIHRRYICTIHQWYSRWYEHCPKQLAEKLTLDLA